MQGAAAQQGLNWDDIVRAAEASQHAQIQQAKQGRATAQAVHLRVVVAASCRLGLGWLCGTSFCSGTAHHAMP